MEEAILDDEPQKGEMPILRTPLIKSIEQLLLGLVLLITIVLLVMNCYPIWWEGQSYLDWFEGLLFSVVVPLIYTVRWNFFSTRIENNEEIQVLDSLKMPITRILMKGNAFLLCYFGVAITLESLIENNVVDLLAGVLLLITGIIYFYYLRITLLRVSELKLSLKNRESDVF